MNQLILTGILLERDVMRFTPAGVPVLSALIRHESEQIEAGSKRLVECEVAALAIGDVAEQLNQMSNDSVLTFTGFIARRFKNSKSLVFHIVSIDKNSFIDTGANHGIR